MSVPMKIEILHNIVEPWYLLPMKDIEKLVYFSYPFYSNIALKDNTFYTVDILMLIEPSLDGEMIIQHYFMVHIDNLIELYVQLPIEDKPIFDVVLYDFWKRSIEALSDINLDGCDKDTLLRVETPLDWRITFENTPDEVSIYITTDFCHYRISSKYYESVSMILSNLPDVVLQNSFSNLIADIEYDGFKIVDLNLKHHLINIYDGAKK